MNEEDIKQFMNAFEDFMKHSDVEQYNHNAWTSARQYTEEFYKKQAAELNVDVKYYMQEFL